MASETSRYVSKIPVRAKHQHHHHHSDDGAPRPASAPALKFPLSRMKSSKLTSNPLRSPAKRGNYDYYELPQQMPDQPYDVKLDKPVAFVDPSDVSFVEEPISKVDLDAVLVGLISPLSKPATPRRECLQHSASVFQKKPIKNSGKVCVTSKKKKKKMNVVSKIPVRSKDKKKDIPNPVAILESISKQSLLDDTKAPFDMMKVLENLSNHSLSDEDKLPLPNIKPEDDSSSVQTEESIFAYFPESDHEFEVEVPLESELEVVQVLHMKTSESSESEHSNETRTIFPVRDLQRKDSCFIEDSTANTAAEIQSRPRENGDGHHVSPEHKVKKISEIELQEQKIPAELAKEEDPRGLLLRKSHDGRNVPALAKNLQTLQNFNCNVILPKTSTIILRKMDEAELSARSSAELLAESSSSMFLSEPRFAAKFAIHNPTTKLFGFKIYCNHAALTHLNVNPKQGFIEPRDRVSIVIRAKKSEILTNERLAKAKFDIKTFICYCNDLARLESNYNEISEKWPALIRTDSVKKVILLDSGDLLSTTKLLDSFRKLSQKTAEEELELEENFENDNDETDGLLNILMNDAQRESLKEEIFSEYANKVLPKVRSRSKLHSMQMELLTTNQKLRTYVGCLEKIEDLLHAVFYFTIVFGAFTWIVPFLNTTEVVVAEVPKVGTKSSALFEETPYGELSFHAKVLQLMGRLVPKLF